MANASKVVKVDREEINVGTKKGQDRACDLYNDSKLWPFYEQHCRFVDFLKTLDRSPVRFNEHHLYYARENFFAIKNRLVFGSNHEPGDLNDSNMIDLFNDVIAGALITNSSLKKGYRAIVLINADEDDCPDISLVGELDGMPLISFNCLAQFYKNDDDMNARFNAGDLTVLDFTEDESLPLNDTEKKLIRSKAGKAKMKGRLGFTLMGGNSEAYRWHRSGTCLLYDAKNKWYLLMGQDEGTYFGVQLPCECQTIKEAFEALTPAEARGAGIKRQGEWFLVPVDEKDVPAMKDCVLQFDNTYDGDSVYLPLETADSHKHNLSASDGRVSKDGKVYAYNPTLEHEDHANVDAIGWFTFVRNTAVRSVSQEGVD